MKRLFWPVITTIGWALFTVQIWSYIGWWHRTGVLLAVCTSIVYRWEEWEKKG